MIHAGQDVMDSLLKAKCLSLLYEAPQCPIIGAVARSVLSRLEHVTARFVVDGFHDLPPSDFNISNFSPSIGTRLLFSRRFGIPVDQQMYLEECAMSGNFAAISNAIPPSPEMMVYVSRYVIG